MRSNIVIEAALFQLFLEEEFHYVLIETFASPSSKLNNWMLSERFQESFLRNRKTLTSVIAGGKIAYMKAKIWKSIL